MSEAHDYHEFIPFRSPKKYSYAIWHNPEAPEDGYLAAESRPKYVRKVQRRYEFQHVHDRDTWMMDVAFISKNLHQGEGSRRSSAEEQEKNMALLDAVQAERLLEDNGDTDMARRTQRIVAYNEKERKVKQSHELVVILLHCTSRFALAWILPSRKAANFQQYLQSAFDAGVRIGTLITDGELGIIKAVRDYNAQQPPSFRINHIVHNMSDPNTFHTQLAPIDRFVRTLRDMFFNLGQLDHNLKLNRDVLQYVIHFYNRTYHATLSKLMGFKITPIQVFKSWRLQDEITRRISSHNYMAVDFDSPLSTVYVYQPPQPLRKRRTPYKNDVYEVKRAPPSKGRYIVRNTRNNDESEELRSHLVYPRT